MICSTGERVTRPRVAILAALLGSDRALSHHEVEKHVNRAFGIDRVTVYRVLDWLSAHGLAHKIAGEDRVWRYNAAANAHRSHAHFQCERCSVVICLDEPRRGLRVRVPRGFVSHEIALTVKGYCAGCVHGESAKR